MKQKKMHDMLSSLSARPPPSSAGAPPADEEIEASREPIEKICGNNARMGVKKTRSFLVHPTQQVSQPWLLSTFTLPGL